jgi:hypothetical protein
MDQAYPTPGESILEARIAGRLTVGFLLDVIEIGRNAATLLDTLLIAAVIDANISRLNHEPALQLASARLDASPPDELRRPVSINALAESLDLPFETVRRHIRQLVARGVCVASPQGLVVPGALLSMPSFSALQRARYERVVRFLAELAAERIVKPPAFALPAADQDHAPVRAVGRILSEFFFRSIGLMKGIVRDPVSGLILLELARASGERRLATPLASGGGPDEPSAVRVAELSRRLRLPYETTRRRVGGLVEDGLCRRRGKGVLLNEEGVGRVEVELGENLVAVRRMCRMIGALAPDAPVDGRPD